MAFDPDKYLAQKKVETSDFDPDKFLAQRKVTKMGGLLSREFPALFSETGEGIKLEKGGILDPEESTVEGALQTLPVAGGLLGGLAGSPVPGAGTIAGAGIGAAGGQAVKQAIAKALNMQSAPKTIGEAAEQVGTEGLLSTAGGAIGTGLSKGISKLAEKASSKAVPKIIKLAGEGAGEAVEQTDDLARLGITESPEKLTAEEIRAATKTFGAEPTKGMITSNKNLQNIESVLEQSPTISGQKIRAQYEPIRKGIISAAEKLSETTPLSKFEVGEEVKKGIVAKVAEKMQPLKMSYQELAESTSNIALNPKSLERTAQALERSNLAEFADLPQGQVIRKYAQNIRQAKSAESLQQLASAAKAQMRESTNGVEKLALGKVIGAIDRAQRRHIFDASKQVAPSKSMAIKTAAEVVQQIKDTNKGWRAMMTEIQEIAGPAKIKGIKSPDQFLDIIEEIPSEQIGQRLFNTKNYEGLNAIKKHLPDEFELMRRARLSEIVEKSMTKGEIDPGKLVRNVKTLGKESRQVLFGANGDKILKDMETVLNSMPTKVGVSDTPRGLAWMNLFKPSSYGQEAGDALKYMVLQGRIAAPLKDVTPKAGGSLLMQSIGQGTARGLLGGNE